MADTERHSSPEPLEGGYEAEDDAGIPVSERHNRRIALRSMLLGMWNLGMFPPSRKTRGGHADYHV